jgi:dTDP-4-amino-4,6-dideoxygalactose transaminase
MDPLPMVDLAAQHAEIADEVRAGWDGVLHRTRFVLGPELEAFEHELAAASGAAGAVGVASGTDALELALRAVGVAAGDHVVIPAMTFVATAGAIVRIGARPVLVDVMADTLLIDVEQATDALDAGARAVVPVHLHGQLAPVRELIAAAARTGAALVEDAAQAHGASRHGTAAGGFGVVAATSFYPGKNLGAYGDGGAVLVPDEATGERVRELRNHGTGSTSETYRVGWNSRLDELQAVVLRAKLRRLESWNQARRGAAARYDQLLADLVDSHELRLPVTAPGNEHAWHLYTVRVANRDNVLARLHDDGIGASVHYHRAIHQHPRFAHLSPGPFPEADRAAAQLLSLPMGPHLGGPDQVRVAEALRRALEAPGRR